MFYPINLSSFICELKIQMKTNALENYDNILFFFVAHNLYDMLEYINYTSWTSFSKTIKITFQAIF